MDKTTYKEFKEYLEKVFEYESGVKMQPVKSDDCPHCGRCPACGRGGYRPWNPYPYPYWYDYPCTWTYHDNSTGDVTVRFS